MDYRDARLEIADGALTIRGYYFPVGAKRIPLTGVKQVRTWPMKGLGLLSGRWRIWGSGDFRHWWNLDPGRPRKTQAFELDLGRHMRPTVTPDDPAAFQAALAAAGVKVS